jgi:protease I
MPGKKILMLLGEFSEDYEIMVPFQALHAVGHTVHAVCPDKRAGEAIKTSVHDFEGDLTYTEKPGHNFTLNKSFDEVDERAYDALYIAGGRGPEYIRLNPRVVEITRHFAEAGKPIGSICHGVQVLVAAEVLDGRRVSALAACEPEVRLARGTYVDLPVHEAMTDGNLVSAPGWPAQGRFLAEFLRALGTEVVHHPIGAAAAGARERAAE